MPLNREAFLLLFCVVFGILNTANGLSKWNQSARKTSLALYRIHGADKLATAVEYALEASCYISVAVLKELYCAVALFVTFESELVVWAIFVVVVPTNIVAV